MNPKPLSYRHPLGGSGPSIVSNDASTVSALTGATGLTGVRTIAFSRYGASITNPSPDPTLQALLPPTVCIKDLIGIDDVPKNETNSPMCISFHLCRLCFANCRRKADHERPLTPQDKTVLLNWVADTLAKSHAAGLIPP